MAKAKSSAAQTEYDPYAPRVPEKTAANTNLTPAEDAVVALNLGKLQRAKDAFESANGSYRNVVKHVEGKGINMKAAKRAISIVKADNRDEIVEELKALFDYLAILGVPVEKKQLDLFRVEQPRTPATDKATEQGRYAGIMGHGSGENPYSIDSPQGQAWMTAWHGGGEERTLILALEPHADELIEGANADDSADDADDPFDAADPARVAAE